MARYIDADELEHMLRTDFDTMYETIFDTLQRVPTIDAVPVVRCKDCKWWADIDGAIKTHGLGACCYANHVMRFGFLTFADWYCADGERKEKE